MWTSTVGADQPSFVSGSRLRAQKDYSHPTLGTMADHAAVDALRTALQEKEGHLLEQERSRAERASMEAEDLRSTLSRQAARPAARQAAAAPGHGAGEALADAMELAVMDTVLQYILRWAEEDRPTLAEQVRDMAPTLARLRADARRRAEENTQRHAARAAPY